MNEWKASDLFWETNDIPASLYGLVINEPHVSTIDRLKEEIINIFSTTGC